MVAHCVLCLIIFSSNKIKMTDSNEGTLCPKVLCELVQSKEPSVHPELGVTLSDVASGGVQHRTDKGNMKRAFLTFSIVMRSMPHSWILCCIVVFMRPG